MDCKPVRFLSAEAAPGHDGSLSVLCSGGGGTLSQLSQVKIDDTLLTFSFGLNVQIYCVHDNNIYIYSGRLPDRILTWFFFSVKSLRSQQIEYSITRHRKRYG